MQNFLIFIEKSLTINIIKMKNIANLATLIHVIIGVAPNICDLKYSKPKEITMIFYSGSNYDYQELAEEFGGQFTGLGVNADKYINFSVPTEKKLKELVKMENKLQKPYPADYNFLVAQALWQVHY